MGNLSEQFDAECSFEILSTAKKDNASVSTIADEEENYHSSGQKFFLSFQFMSIKLYNKAIFPFGNFVWQSAFVN